MDDKKNPKESRVVGFEIEELDEEQLEEASGGAGTCCSATGCDACGSGCGAAV